MPGSIIESEKIDFDWNDFTPDDYLPEYIRNRTSIVRPAHLLDREDVRVNMHDRSFYQFRNKYFKACAEMGMHLITNFDELNFSEIETFLSIFLKPQINGRLLKLLDVEKFSNIDIYNNCSDDHHSYWVFWYTVIDEPK